MEAVAKSKNVGHQGEVTEVGVGWQPDQHEALVDGLNRLDAGATLDVQGLSGAGLNARSLREASVPMSRANEFRKMLRIVASWTGRLTIQLSKSNLTRRHHWDLLAIEAGR
jgi:hypothetical protein